MGVISYLEQNRKSIETLGKGFGVTKNTEREIGVENARKVCHNTNMSEKWHACHTTVSHLGSNRKLIRTVSVPLGKKIYKDVMSDIILSYDGVKSYLELNRPGR